MDRAHDKRYGVPVIRVIPFAVFFVFFQSSLFSLDVKLSFDVDISLKDALTKEIVTEGEKTISRLDWTDKYSPNFSVAGNVSLDNVFLQFGVNCGLPFAQGTMEDYDFLLPDSDAASRYSRHDSYLDKSVTYTFRGGYCFSIGSIYILPTIGMLYRNTKWTAANGYLQYPVSGPWTGEEVKKPVTGSVISYEQALWFPFGILELGYTYPFGVDYTISHALYAGVFPYLWAHTSDTHFLRSTQFYDVLEGGIGWYSGFRTAVYLKKLNNIGFFIEISNETVKDLRGKTASNSTGLNSGPLTADKEYGSRIEYVKWRYFIGIHIPVLD